MASQFRTILNWVQYRARSKCVHVCVVASQWEPTGGERGGGDGRKVVRIPNYIQILFICLFIPLSLIPPSSHLPIHKELTAKSTVCPYLR